MNDFFSLQTASHQNKADLWLQLARGCEGAASFKHFFNTENVKGYFTRKKTREGSGCEYWLGGEILAPRISMGVLWDASTDYFNKTQKSFFSS